MQALGAVGHVTVLERPLTPVTLLSTVQVALRSRRRQHELRQLHAVQHRHIAEQAATPGPAARAGPGAPRPQRDPGAAGHSPGRRPSEHEMAERQRLEREAQRVQHFAMLGRLAAGVSHEIRNPLSAVFLHVDLLSEELQQPSPDSPAVVAEALAEIKTQLARVEDLVQDYLALVRVGAIERTPQDLGPAVQAWATEFQALAAPQGVSLQLEGLAALGPVAFHAAHVAPRAAQPGAERAGGHAAGGTLTLTGRSTPTHVQLQVRDTGSGIASAQLATIFEPLYTTKPGGTGLGLYIVQEIVAAHGGQVTVESGEGQGTTFTLTLPRGLREAGEGS